MLIVRTIDAVSQAVVAFHDLAESDGRARQRPPLLLPDERSTWCSPPKVALANQ